MLACAAMTCPALATDDPLTIVGNLSDFVFFHHQGTGRYHPRLGHRAGGYVHPVPRCQQRTQGFLCLFGGLMIAFAKEILTAIGAV